jgi:hypothetical protein
MSDPAAPPSPPARKVPIRVPWGLLYLPVLVVILWFVWHYVHPVKGSEEAALRAKAEQNIKSIVPPEITDIKAVSVEISEPNATISGTAISSGPQGEKKHYEWRVTLTRIDNQWKPTASHFGEP